VYTAFGELVSGTSGRFGYVGAHGYQTSDEMPYQHVGNRYYDPTTGRFLQRDPMGIRGGSNVYLYASALPTGSIDPDGLYDSFEGAKGALITGVVAAIAVVGTGGVGAAAGITIIVASAIVGSGNGVQRSDWSNFKSWFRNAADDDMYYWGYGHRPGHPDGWYCGVCGQWYPWSEPDHLHRAR